MRRRRVALLAVLVVGSLVATVGVGPDGDDGALAAGDTGDPPAERLVRPVDGGSALWPYTSRRRDAAGRTLAINAVIVGSPDRVRTVLTRRSDANWTGADRDAAVATPPWRPTSGARRFTYVARDPERAGEWVDASYQLGVGSYFARRTHVRAYPSADGNWTALQVHTEYWDWFRLRHTVTGLVPGVDRLERDLRDEPVTAGLHREYHGLGGSGNSGWLTVVELVPGLIAAGVLSRSHRGVSIAEASIPAALVGLVVGVRAVGVAAGAVAVDLNPKVLSAGLYPVLALGPLAVVRSLADRTEPRRAAALTGFGLGAGVVLDFALIGVEVVPVRLALGRVALAAALALVALGVARGERRVVAVGVGAWLLALCSPLFGLP